MRQAIHVEQFVDGQKFGLFNLKLLFWSFLAMFADGYDIAAMAFAAPELGRAWGIPVADFRWALTAPLFGVLFGAPLLGWFGDRAGRKRAVIVSCVIYGLGTLACAAAANLDQIVVLRFLTGIGIGGLMPNTIALNSELSPRRLRATLVVLMFTGITLGGSVPGVIAAELVPVWGWQVLFVVGGVAPLAIAACLALAMPESIKFLAGRPALRAQALRVARAMRRDVAIPDDAEFVTALAQQPSPDGMLGLRHIYTGHLLWFTPLLWICFGTALMANFFLNSWLPLIFEGAGLTPREAALAGSLYHIGGTAGGILVSLVLDRYGFLATSALFLIAAPAIAAIGLPGNGTTMLTALAALAGFGVLGAQFGNNASAGLLYPTAFRSQGVGWALGIGRFGSIVGPLLGGTLIAMQLPLQQLFLAAALPMFLGLAACLLLVRSSLLRFRGLRIDDTLAPAAAGRSH